MPANELNLRKKQYVQELNGFIGLKKAYTGAAGQRAELLDGAKTEADKLSGVHGGHCWLCAGGKGNLPVAFAMLSQWLAPPVEHQRANSACIMVTLCLNKNASPAPGGWPAQRQPYLRCLLRARYFSCCMVLLHLHLQLRLAALAFRRHEHHGADAAGAAAGEGDGCGTAAIGEDCERHDGHRHPDRRDAAGADAAAGEGARARC